MTNKRPKVPTTREAAERRILARQAEKLDASCDHLVDATRVLIGADPAMSKVATLAAHIIGGETDINRVAQVAVRLAWRLTVAREASQTIQAEAVQTQTELDQARETLARTEAELVRQQNAVRELRREIADETVSGSFDD